MTFSDLDKLAKELIFAAGVFLVHDYILQKSNKPITKHITAPEKYSRKALYAR